MIILVDADDTLWHCSRYFFEAINSFRSLLSECFSPLYHCAEDLNFVDDLMKRFTTLEVSRVPTRGKTIERFTESMLLIYAMGCQGMNTDYDPLAEEQIRALARGPQECQPELYPNVIEGLTALIGQCHELILYTESDPALTAWKLEVTGLRSYFAVLKVVPMKTIAMLQQTVTEFNDTFGIQVDLVVGNSMTSDIFPAQTLGIKTVLVPQGEWAYDHVHAADPTWVAKDLLQVAALLESLEHK